MIEWVLSLSCSFILNRFLLLIYVTVFILIFHAFPACYGCDNAAADDADEEKCYNYDLNLQFFSCDPCHLMFRKNNQFSYIYPSIYYLALFI